MYMHMYIDWPGERHSKHASIWLSLDHLSSIITLIPMHARCQLAGIRG